MGVSRSDLFDIEQNELAQLARIFSHPARIAILQFMAEKGVCSNGDLVTHLGLAQATISQHLRELKLAGLITGSVEENSVSYRIEYKNWEESKNLFIDLFDRISSDK